jgi:citrate synthase
MTQEQGFSKGLADVIADATSVSQVQGEEGRLIYRGIAIEELAEHATFEEVAHFLLKGELPLAQDLDRTKKTMSEGRSLPQHVEALIDNADKSAHPMQVLQAAVATLSFGEGQVKLNDTDGNINRALKLASQVATAVARFSRRRRGLEPIPPMPELSHAENFLYMVHGKRPSKEEARIFDVSLILHADHDFNASTFAGRVIASTEAGLIASVSGAVGALSGPLHGGANEKVLRMVDEIGDAKKAREWVLDALANKKKVMGFGHRVYRTMDPRAKVLRVMLENLVAARGDRSTYDTLLAVHDTMIEELSKKQKDYIWPNVDFWSGSLLRLLGFDPIDFTPIFAVARVVGWCSHIVEMWQDNRLYRPAAKYVGPINQHYVPVDKRRISA